MRWCRGSKGGETGKGGVRKGVAREVRLLHILITDLSCGRMARRTCRSCQWRYRRYTSAASWCPPLSSRRSTWRGVVGWPFDCRQRPRRRWRRWRWRRCCWLQWWSQGCWRLRWRWWWWWWWYSSSSSSSSSTSMSRSWLAGWLAASRRSWRTRRHSKDTHSFPPRGSWSCAASRSSSCRKRSSPSSSSSHSNRSRVHSKVSQLRDGKCTSHMGLADWPGSNPEVPTSHASYFTRCADPTLLDAHRNATGWIVRRSFALGPHVFIAAYYRLTTSNVRLSRTGRRGKWFPSPENFLLPRGVPRTVFFFRSMSNLSLAPKSCVSLTYRSRVCMWVNDRQF